MGAQMRRTANGINDSYAPIKLRGRSDPSKPIGFRNIWMRPPHRLLRLQASIGKADRITRPN